MWGARPVLVVGAWSSDGRANSCAGWGQQTHMFGQEMSVSFPDRGGEEIECPSPDRKLDTQQMPTGSQAVSETPAAPGPPAQAEGVEGRVLGRHTHTHSFGDNSHTFRDHTDRVHYGAV